MSTKIYTGPTLVHRYAKAYQARGIEVLAEGTEHIYLPDMPQIHNGETVFAWDYMLRTLTPTMNVRLG